MHPLAMMIAGNGSEARARDASAVVAPPPARSERSASQLLTELEAVLLSRNEELARLEGLYKQLHAEVEERAEAATAASAEADRLVAEADALRGELRQLRESHVACREELDDVRGKYAALEAQLAKLQRSGEIALSECERRRASLEHELRKATAELAATKQTLAITAENLKILRDAHNEWVTSPSEPDSAP